MRSVEQTSTKETSLKFSPMTSVPSTDKSNLVETPMTTITEHAPVQNTAPPITRTVLVSNIAINQQQAEITQIAREPLPATLPLQRKPRQNDVNNDINGKYLVSNAGKCTRTQFAVLSTSQSFFKPCCPSSSRDHSKLCSFWTRPDSPASSRATPWTCRRFR